MRDFSQTKWKVERRYSTSDKNAPIFIPLKQPEDRWIMERAGYEVSKEHGELSKELRTSGSCKMGYTTNCLKKYIAPETWSLEDGISSSFLRPLAVPGCRCCHQCPLLLRLFLWNLYHERRPLKNPVDACISNSRLFCYFNFILASAGPWGPWQVSSLFSMPLK